MVSKRAVLGKPLLIFVTIGTTSFAFYRLYKSLDTYLMTSKLNANVVAQVGTTNYTWHCPNVQSIGFLSPTEVANYVKTADKIITHGGPGTLYTIANHARIMPLAICRLKMHKEHVDDHQKYFLTYVRNKLPNTYGKYFATDSRIENALKNYLGEKKHPNGLKRYLFTQKTKSNILNNLQDYFDSI